MSAHCSTFYLDATVTSSIVLTFLLLELANHQDIQEKLRKQILSVGKKPEDFDFDKINSISYLQMVFDGKETNILEIKRNYNILKLVAMFTKLYIEKKL